MVNSVSLTRGARRDPGRRSGAELLGLDPRALGEVATRDARREAEVVLDPGRSRQRPAGGHRVEDDGLQALRRRVHGGSQARRAGAHDDEVADLRGGRRHPEPDDVGQAPRRSGCAAPRPPQMTTGVSAGWMPSRCSSSSAAGSSSRSIHRCGNRLRAANSATGVRPGRTREPMIRSTHGRPISRSRRMMRARRTMSPSAGSDPTSSRTRSTRGRRHRAGRDGDGAEELRPGR